MKHRLFVCFASLVLFSSLSLGQQMSEEGSAPSAPNPELERKALLLANEAADESATLHLWENRALIIAGAADLLWKTDEPAARKMFNGAIGELMNGLDAVPKKTGDFIADYTSRDRFSSRKPVLLMIASHDADWALKLLEETRPHAVTLAIQRRQAVSAVSVPGDKSPAQMEAERADKNLSESETLLEQAIAKMAVAQNPKKAAALIRKSLKDGVSDQLVPLVRKVYQQDKELAGELFLEILEAFTPERLLERDSYGSTSTIWKATSVLRNAVPKPGKETDRERDMPEVPESALKAFTSRLLDAVLASKGQNQNWSLSTIAPYVEQILPERKAELERNLREIGENSSPIEKANLKFIEIVSNEKISITELVEAADDFSGYQKKELYEQAIRRADSVEQLDEVERLIRASAPSTERDDAIERVSVERANRQIGKSDVDALSKMIDAAPNRTAQFKMLVKAARSLAVRNDNEAEELAITYLDRASRYVGKVPESKEDAELMVLLAGAYASVKPEDAFDYIEGLGVMTNDMLLANALQAKYDNRSTKFLENEAILSQNIPKELRGNVSAIKKLAKFDFERTVGLIDGINRSDVRTLYKLLLSQAILKGSVGFEGGDILTFSYFSID